MIQALIVDDEAPARDKLRLWLHDQPDFNIAGEFADGLSAAEGLAARTTDVVFLDVQMPGLTGLELAAQLEPTLAPLLVFVTAYDAHALAAFELNAVDYLLKPYDRDRFERTLDRVRDRLKSVTTRASQVALARAQTGVSDRLLVPTHQGLRMIESASVHSLEADDNYVRAYTSDQCFLLRRTLRDLLVQLGEHRFVRIHKSVAVNIREIDSLTPLFKGDFEIRLRSGKLLRLSRRYAADLFALMGR
ncbi:MAG TPA: LytTR family transcriptional regulator DNA-binding domain-containing protein [Steroidobacteraceae bacterium]|jgi:two-component system LytT family response regulator|nr:LytTR family transcriptional regulator DNA-binding domain-containing protein [Steroidobacteraceae bacterium]